MSDFRCHLLWHSAYLYFHLILSLSDRSYSLHLGKFIRSSEKKWSLNKIQIRINKLYMVLIEKKVFRWKRIYGIFFILLSILWTSLKPWGICQYLWFWQNVLQIHIHIYPAAGWERVEVKQLYSVYSNNKKLILKLYNKTPKQMFVIKYTNIFKYVLFKRWFVWQTCFSFGSCFRIPNNVPKFCFNLISRRLKSGEVKSLASSFRIFFSFSPRNSFTKTSLC